LEDKVPGKVTIAPEVLMTIVQLTVQEIDGVYQMSADWARDVTRFLGNMGIGDGVQIEVQDGRVNVDLFVIVEHDANLLQLGRHIQAAVTRAIEELVGMDVKEVNVHIEDVHYPPVQL
jgi:uncharacterized alkaline shock family protein YloU